MPRKYKSKKGGKRKGGRRAPRPRSTFSVSDFGSLSVSTNFTGLTTNTVYSSLTTQLSDYARAVDAASAYQFYRITGIEFKFVPRLDTYPAGGPATVPNLLYMIDKSGSIPTTVTLGNLLQMGAKPRRFDDKNLVVKWRPSVLTDVAFNSGGAAANSVPSQYKISPWLATNANSTSAAPWAPSSVNHLGLHWVIETTGTNSLYDIIVTCHFQFKKPLVQVDPGAPASTPLSSVAVRTQTN